LHQNPQKWVINESILPSLTGCFSLKPTAPLSIRQTTPTDWGPGHNRGKARTNSDAIPELVKNFKKDVLGEPF
jgi:hypothetical protein